MRKPGALGLRQLDEFADRLALPRSARAFILSSLLDRSRDLLRQNAAKTGSDCLITAESLVTKIERPLGKDT